jgi:predicted nucleic acid-binding protein
MARAVLNASPLILLGKGGLLHILSNLFDELFVPTDVLSEIGVRDDDESSKLLRKVPKLSECSVAPAPGVQSWDLGRGETAVISFALANPGTIAVLDDAEARACCRSFGLPTAGTGAILVRAKAHNLIPSVRETLSLLRAHGLWISDSVVDTLCAAANE